MYQCIIHEVLSGSKITVLFSTNQKCHGQVNEQRYKQNTGNHSDDRTPSTTGLLGDLNINKEKTSWLLYVLLLLFLKGFDSTKKEKKKHITVYKFLVCYE